MPDDPSPHAPHGADILLVDDRPANLLALEAVLSDLGEHLVRASSGEEALRRLADRDFAVVLLDVHMPGLSGFDTANRYSPPCSRTSPSRPPLGSCCSPPPPS